MDATHEATGKTVYIKEVGTGSEELRIAELLMEKEWVSDPRNHCVPVTKLFKDHQNAGVSYIVMPFLRPVDSPPFEYVKEIIEFTDQILEVAVDRFPNPVADLNFLRVWYFSMRKGWHTGTIYFPGPVSWVTSIHSDCVQANLMMDADRMYPEGFHPVRIHHTPDRSDFAEHTSRSAGTVKYYFIDFGISVYIPENLRPKLVTGALGRDQDPPELSEQVPYDPFKLDIFIIGNMFKRDFYKVRPSTCPG